jgi:hypothetical protein
MKIDYTKTIPFLILGVGIVYEVMYFIGIGIDIRNAPHSKFDYLSNWTEWIYYIAGMLLFFIFDLFSSKLENWKTEEQIISSTSNPTFYKKLRASPAISIKYLSFILFFIFLFVGEIAFHTTLVFSTVFMIIFYEYLILGSPLQKKIPQRLTIFTLILLCGIGSIGYSNGIRDYHSSFQENYKNNLLINNEKINVLRIYENWSLVRRNNEGLYWISNSTEKVIIINSDKNQFIGIGCYLKFNFELTKNINLPYCNHFYQ